MHSRFHRAYSSGIGTLLRGSGQAGGTSVQSPLIGLYTSQGAPSITIRTKKRPANSSPSLLERVAAKRLRGQGVVQTDDSFGIVDRAGAAPVKETKKRTKRRVTTAAPAVKNKKKHVEKKPKLKPKKPKSEEPKSKKPEKKGVTKKGKPVKAKRSSVVKQKPSKKVQRKSRSRKKFDFLDK